MSNLLNSVKDLLTPELLSEAANLYGENEVGIHKTVSSLVPTILTGILVKSGDSHALDKLYAALKNFDPTVLNHLSSQLSVENQAKTDPKDLSGQLLGIIFGAKVPAITNVVASFSGVKASTVSSLLGLAGPMVMALMHKKIEQEGLNPSTMVRYLLAQRNQVQSLLPAGVGSLLGLANQPGIGAGAGAGAFNPKIVKFWPLLLVIGLGLAIVIYLKYC